MYSKDAFIRPKDLIKRAFLLGLRGVAITDHNEIKGALESMELAKELDLKIIPGEEVRTTHGDLLIYNIEERVDSGMSIEETIEVARELGGTVVIPHPFDSLRREALGREAYRCVKMVDAVEVVNGRSLSRDNKKACLLAQEFNKPGIGGSDAHLLRELGRVRTFLNEDDLLQPIKIEMNRPPTFLLDIFLSFVKKIT